MIEFRQGNLLATPAEALVNTVNTVGVMGKGIALMFKEAFPENFRLYEAACKRNEVQVGRVFVTENLALEGPRWIINFPTKQDWRRPSQLRWIEEGLRDLHRVITDRGIQSLALPPLGCGNGGLEWAAVRPVIERELGGLADVEITVFEPTEQYQNVAKRSGVKTLTTPRALMAELVRRYWVLGQDCSNLEVQKLGWFLERAVERMGLENPLQFQFEANRYGPYSDPLRHLLNQLDGSYLHSAKRLADAGPTDSIWFDEERAPYVAAYLEQPEQKAYRQALEETSRLIDGFESPLGMELLATVDWLLAREGCEPTVASLRDGLSRWQGGEGAGERKLRLFDERLLGLALERLVTVW